jgi:hypothetical protein
VSDCGVVVCVHVCQISGGDLIEDVTTGMHAQEPQSALLGLALSTALKRTSYTVLY